MILDRMENRERYVGLHGAFGEAFAFLAALDPAGLKAGRIDIDGPRIYAVVVDGDGKGEAAARLETHRQYIDIQYQVAGTDHIGWAPAAGLPGEGYRADNDIEFHPAAPETWVNTPPGRFAVFFPSDAHAPMGATGRLLKVVVKVRVEG